MSLDDWALALHVLSAFALVAGIVLFWVLIVAVRRTDSPTEVIRMGPLQMVADGAIGVGAVGTVLLGVWLAFSVGGYELWNGWIITALVLWVIMMALGERTNTVYRRSVAKARELQDAGQTGPSTELVALNRTSVGVLLHLGVSVVALLILLDMIWKPGA
jgi:uncharacterized membrane protein